MAIISVYIPDGDFQRTLDAICNNYKYQENFTSIETSLDDELTPVQTVVTITNPQTKSQFVNQIIRNFISEHVKTYEVEIVKKQAVETINDSENIVVDDGATASVYKYNMICLAPAKSQYDALSQVIAPGNSFSVALSSNGQLPVSHYATEVGITETARQQLLVLELAGGTSTDGIQTLFYVRCDPYTNIAQATNIDGYDIVGQECSVSKLIQYLGLQEC